MGSFEFSTLGRVDLRGPGGPVLSVLAQPRSLSLLAYLASGNDCTRTRDAIIALLWPEARDREARHSLNQLLYTLRKSFGPSTFECAGAHLVQLNAAVVRVDVAEFIQDCTESPQQALEAWGGEFMPGFHLPGGSPEFDEWLDTERSRLRGLALAAAEELASEARLEDRPRDELRWTEFASRVVPYDEQYVRRVVELLDSAGDKGGALRRYHEYADRLRTNVGLAPSLEFASLINNLTASADLERRPTAATLADSAERPPIAEQAALPSETPRATGRAVRILLALGGLALFAMVSWTIASARPSDPVLQSQRVYVTPLENHTGDPSLDVYGLVAADWLVQGLLSQGIGEAIATLEVLRSRGASDAIDVDSPIERGRQLAREAHAGILIEGSFSRLATDSLRILTRIVDVASGSVVRAIEVAGVATGDAMSVLHEQRERTLSSLGTLLDQRLSQWSDHASQPPNLSAYRYYMEGITAFLMADREVSGDKRRSLFQQAATSFNAASTIDTAFTAPLIWEFYSNVNGDGNYNLTLQQLHGRRALMAPWDRAMADHVLSMMERNYTASFEAAKQVLRYAPDSEWSYKLAYVGRFILRLEEAEASLRSADPRSGWLRSWPAYWSLLAEILHARGRHKDELLITDEFDELFPARSLESRTRVLVALGRIRDAVGLLDANLALEEPRAWLGIARRTILEMRLHGFDEAADRQAAVLVGLWHGDLRRATAEQDPAVRLEYAGLLVESDPEAAMPIFKALSRDHSERSVRSNPALVGLGVVAARTGMRDLADSVLAAIDGSPRQGDDRQQIPYATATILAALGRKDEAFMAFKEAVQASDGMIHYGYHYPSNFSVSMRNYLPLREFTRPRS